MADWWKGLGTGGQVAVGIVGFLMLIVIIGALGGGDDGSGGGSSADKSDDGSGQETRVVPVGTPITQKETTYEVLSAEATSSVGDAYLSENASGAFVVVKLAFTNRKDEPATIDISNIELVGGNGSTYSADEEASIYLDDAFTFFEEIQPGVKQTGSIAYDLPPKAVSGSRLKASDFWSGDSVEVDLGL